MFPLALRGLTAGVEADGSVSLRDGAGAVRATVPAGWMSDAAGATSGAVGYRLLDRAAGPALEVTVDRAWLTAPGRAFPVRVDPSFGVDTAADDTFVQSDATTTDFSTGTRLRAGRATFAGNPVTRSFLHLDLAPVAGKTINYANLLAFNTLSSSCTAQPMTAKRVTAGWSGSSTR